MTNMQNFCNNEIRRTKTGFVLNAKGQKSQCSAHCFENWELSKKIIITFEKSYAFSCVTELEREILGNFSDSGLGWPQCEGEKVILVISLRHCGRRVGPIYLYVLPAPWQLCLPTNTENITSHSNKTVLCWCIHCVIEHVLTFTAICSKKILACETDPSHRCKMVGTAGLPGPSATLHTDHLSTSFPQYYLVTTTLRIYLAGQTDSPSRAH